MVLHPTADSVHQKRRRATRSENHTHAPEEPLADGVLPGGTVRRAQLHDTAGRRNARESLALLAVAVADEVSGALVEGRRLAQLLGDPGVGRAARHADVDHPARAQLHEEEGE